MAHKHRKKNLRHRYGLSELDYERIKFKQNYLCPICLKKLDNTATIDHDHSCCPIKSSSCGSCVRGIICRKCNMALGSFKDSTDELLNILILVLRGLDIISPNAGFENRHTNLQSIARV